MSAEDTHDIYGRRVYSRGFPEGFGYIRGYGRTWYPGFFGKDRNFAHFRKYNGTQEVERYSRDQCLQYVLNYIKEANQPQVKPNETHSIEREVTTAGEEVQKNIETVADLAAFLSLPQNREGTWWNEDEGIVRFWIEDDDEEYDDVSFSMSESEFVESFFSQFGLRRDTIYYLKKGK